MALRFSIVAAAAGLAVAALALPSRAGADLSVGRQTPGPTCGPLYAADSFSRSVPPGHTWGQPELGLGPWEVSFGGSQLGLWSVGDGVAKATATSKASTGQRVRGARNVDMTVRFAFSALSRTGTLSTGLFARFRTVGGPTGDYVRMRVRHDEGRRLRISLSRVVGTVTTTIDSKSLGLAKKRHWYWMRFQAVDDRIRGKVWSRGEREPRWQLSMQDPTIGAMQQTDVGIRNTHVTGVDLPLIVFDDFAVSAPGATPCALPAVG